MSGNCDVSIVHNNQLYSIPVTAATTFSFLLHRAHQLFNIQPDAACPFQLTNSAGASFDKLGDSSVLSCVKDDRRLMFGPREAPVKRTLTQLLHSVDVMKQREPEERQDDDDDDDDDSSSDDDDDQDDDSGDKENRQQDGSQTPQKTAAAGKDAAASPSAAATQSCVPLPASSSPIQSQLWRIFTFYCLQGVKAASSSSSSPSASAAASPFESLSSSSWVRLLEDCLVVNSTAAASPPPAASSCVPLSRHQAELLHLTVSKRSGRFSYEAFVLSLCKVGVAAYRHQLQPAAALSTLLLQHILPLAQRDNPLQHAPLLSHPMLAAVTTAFSAFITAAFTAYAGASSSSNPDFLSFAAYSQWLSDCKLTKLVPAAETSRCFVLSVDEDGEMRADGCRLRLSRAGFQQCVGRLILQGLGRKQPVNAFVAKALFAHCQSNLSLQHRLLKATPADRKALERMQKSLDAACQLLVKQDGKRDYLQAAATIRSALPQPPPLTAFQQQPWQQLMARDAAFAAVAASLSTHTDADATGRAGAAARLSAGKAARRPAAVKTAPSASKPASSGKKAAKSVRPPAAADAAVEASDLFASPKTPRVVALVPRTPAAKKSADSRRPAETESSEEEEEDEDEDEEEEQRRAAAERERQLQADRELRAQKETEEVKAREEEARLQEQRRREEDERQQEQARLVRQQQEEAEAEKARARQREEAAREDRWQKEKEAEVAKMREQERQEREGKEQQMQREIQQLRDALAAQQQQHKRRSSSKQRPAAAVAPARAAAAPSSGQQLQPKHEEETKTAISSGIEQDAATAARPLAAVSPTVFSGSSNSEARVSDAAPAAARSPSAGVQLPSAPAIVSAPAAPILQERPLPTTLLPARLPSQRLSLTATTEQRPSSGRTEAMAEAVLPEEEFKVQPAAAQLEEEEELSSEDESESEEEEEAKEDPRRLMFHASMSQADSSDDEDEDEDADDSSRQQQQAEAAGQGDSEEEEEDDESEDEAVGPLTVAIDCSYSVNQSRASLALESGDAEDGELQAALDNSLTNVTRTIHSINVSHSQSHDLPSHQQPDVPAAPALSASEEEEEEELSGPAVYPAPFDSALHEERLRLLQAELKEVLAARRRLQRRASYMEEVEDKRLQEELKSKQRAILQLKMLRAKQERERAKAEEEQERARRRAAAEEAEAQQRLEAEEAERQREQAEQESRAKAEREESWRKATLQAEAARRAQQQQEQLAAAAASSPPSPPSVPSLPPSLLSSSLIRAVESGDTFLRYYCGWWRKPKSKFVRVSHSSLRVYWGKDCYHLSKWIEIAQVQQVREASQSSAASTVPVELLGQALSIECEDGKRSLHLVASNHATREVWRRYLEAVLSMRK